MGNLYEKDNEEPPIATKSDIKKKLDAPIGSVEGEDGVEDTEDKILMKEWE